MKRTFAAFFIFVAAACQPAAPDRVERAQQPQQERTIPMPQTLHVVSIGDSLAYGAGDESGRGIAGRLDAELRARGVSEVETVNLGVNGAQTGDVLRKLAQKRTREQLAKADAIVLSIGANDLFRSPHSREEIMRAPFAVAERILGNIVTIVAKIHEINPRARVLVLGGYNPVPSHDWAPMINQYLSMWDGALAKQFERDRRVAVVKMADIVTPQRLSRYDSFHPGSAAYHEAARRIATMLLEEVTAA